MPGFSRVSALFSVLSLGRLPAVVGGLALLAAIGGPPTIAAQETPFSADAWDRVAWSDEIPAHLDRVDGIATLDRDGGRETADIGTPLLAGDRLRTENGRLDILFADGSALDIDRDTTLDLLDTDLLRLGRGRLRLAIVRGASTTNFRVDAAGVTAWLRAGGEYRLEVTSARGDEVLRLTVIRGSAELDTRYGRPVVRAGMETVASAARPPVAPYVVSASSRDAFDRWVEDVRDERLDARSSAYLPNDLRVYGGALERDGAWGYLAPYGYVWYPRVAPEWHPYSTGRWTVVGSFGWTWIGNERWSWPTHHYGRWGTSVGRWYWIPDRRWAPAWVSWASAPGYLAWCPLGYDSRPVVSVTAISVSIGSPRRAWSVVPAGRFANRFVHPSDVVGSVRLTLRDRFEPRRSFPEYGPVPHGNSGPIRAPGRGDARPAVPREVAMPRADVRPLGPRQTPSIARPAAPAERADQPGPRGRMENAPPAPTAPRVEPARPSVPRAEPAARRPGSGPSVRPEPAARPESVARTPQPTARPETPREPPASTAERAGRRPSAEPESRPASPAPERDEAPRGSAAERAGRR